MNHHCLLAITPQFFRLFLKYQALEALIAPNTTLFLFTDGLNEAINTSKERFDRESIMVVAHQAIADRQLSPQSLIQRMEKAV